MIPRGRAWAFAKLIPVDAVMGICMQPGFLCFLTFRFDAVGPGRHARAP